MVTSVMKLGGEASRWRGTGGCLQKLPCHVRTWSVFASGSGGDRQMPAAGPSPVVTLWWAVSAAIPGQTGHWCSRCGGAQT